MIHNIKYHGVTGDWAEPPHLTEQWEKSWKTTSFLLLKQLMSIFKTNVKRRLWVGFLVSL